MAGKTERTRFFVSKTHSLMVHLFVTQAGLSLAPKLHLYINVHGFLFLFYSLQYTYIHDIIGNHKCQQIIKFIYLSNTSYPNAMNNVTITIITIITTLILWYIYSPLVFDGCFTHGAQASKIWIIRALLTQAIVVAWQQHYLFASSTDVCSWRVCCEVSYMVRAWA